MSGRDALIRRLCLLLLLPCGLLGQVTEAPYDLDRDGVPDALEQQLLERFRPSFHVSATDCAGLPARFEPGLAIPKSSARDGSIYGQVFRPTAAGPLLEIHYYMLWDQDCGRMGHALDAEHVSALVRADSAEAKAEEWQAQYWYAGAHEKTVCEVSSAARAASIGAGQKGPEVWASSGKHALFFSPAQCSGGCGDDRCTDGVALKRDERMTVINLGERGAPLNGNTWAGAAGWPLSLKMGTDFSDAVLAQVAAAPNQPVVTLAGRGQRPAIAVIKGGDATMDALATSDKHTEAALDRAGTHASGGLGKGLRATGAALKGAFGATKRWLRGKR